MWTSSSICSETRSRLHASLCSGSRQEIPAGALGKRISWRDPLRKSVTALPRWEFSKSRPLKNAQPISVSPFQGFGASPKSQPGTDAPGRVLPPLPWLGKSNASAVGHQPTDPQPTDPQTYGRNRGFPLPFETKGHHSPLSIRWIQTLIICVLLALLALLSAFKSTATHAQTTSVQEAIATTLPRVVKINGTGGSRGLESYQSGCLISKDGHVLTVWSYVLDSDVVTVTLHDGSQSEGKLLGFDPRLDIAVLKIELTDNSCFDFKAPISAETGDRILAFSNLYGVATGNEPVSIQQGYITSISPLSAGNGAFDSPWHGDAIKMDAMTNNPGAAGGAITDTHGHLIGMIGRELQDRQTGEWLNYALPLDAIAPSIDKILSGKMQVLDESDRRTPAESMTPELLGFRLVPDIILKTPPFVDRVAWKSTAGQSGMKADDLIIEVNGAMTPTTADVRRRLSTIDRDAEVTIAVQRKNAFVEFVLRLAE